MKKFIFLFILFFISANVYSQNKINVFGGYYLKTDKGFKKNYGNGVFLTSIMVSKLIKSNFGIDISISYFKKRGVSSELKDSLSTNQFELGFSAFYDLIKNRKIFLNIFAGLSYVMVKEDTQLSGIYKENAIGEEFGVSVGYNLSKKISLVIKSSYLNSKKDIGDKIIDFGGIRFLIGIGVF